MANSNKAHNFTQTLAALGLALALPISLCWYYDVYIHWQPGLYPFAVVAVIFGNILLTMLALRARGEKSKALAWKTLLSSAVFMAVLFTPSSLINNVMHRGAALAANVAVPLAAAQWIVLFVLLLRKMQKPVIAIIMAVAWTLIFTFTIGVPYYMENIYKAPGTELPEGLFAAAPEPDEPINIGNRVEMLVDDYLIASTDNAGLRLHKPIPGEIALAMSEPWEGPGSGVYSTVFKDGDIYRMYYRAIAPENEGGDHGESQFTCCAESADGIAWERKTLGLIEFQGNKDNNIVMAGVEAHNFAPWLDENPGCPPEEKYKALNGLTYEDGRHGLFAYKSADGFAWEKLQETPVITEGAFDSLNSWFWDSNIAAYRCYSRYMTGQEETGTWSGVRAIQSHTSKDFCNWSAPAHNSYNEGVPLEHFYTNATVLCPGAEHFYLSFPMRFVPERKKWADYEWAGVSDAIFMTSRDGTRFERSFMEPWIAPGLDPRNWTQRSFITASGILETSPEEFSLYVNEHYSWDDSYIRRYTVRRHGFGSMYSDYRGGIFTTRQIIFDGDALYINYATSAVGNIRVGIYDAETGVPLRGFALDDCDEIFGNELDKQMTWKGKGDVSKLRGQPVRLVFELKDADLFAFRFA